MNNEKGSNYRLLKINLKKWGYSGQAFKAFLSHKIFMTQVIQC